VRRLFRKPPIAAAKLRDYLVEHKLATGRDGDQLLFGRTGSHAFNGKNLPDRADAAWAEAGLDRITPHECRHTFASLMIAAGVNAKAFSTYMGHANISITLDRYGHLMPGNEGEAAGLLDAYREARLPRSGREQLPFCRCPLCMGKPSGARSMSTEANHRLAHWRRPCGRSSCGFQGQAEVEGG
jgi:hypothetical protein